VLRLRREALLCAMVAFPLFLVAAAAFDLAFVIVSFLPHMTFFLGLEGIMPAYHAYRILVEVVLEALPQVVLQMIALLVLKQQPFQLWGLSIPQIIAISMTIALLNLVKTLIILKVEATELDLTLVQYIKCALCLLLLSHASTGRLLQLLHLAGMRMFGVDEQRRHPLRSLHTLLLPMCGTPTPCAQVPTRRWQPAYDAAAQHRRQHVWRAA
jgi:branched-subunit amino acid transport protein AzlD